MNTHRLAAAVVAVTATAVLLVGIASAKNFSAWAQAQKIDEIGGNSAELNTAALDGCPIQSPDGLSLYMASNRPGGHGLLDIWVAHRSSLGEPWGAPVNLPAPINSAADDFCPTPVRGKGLFFVSRKVVSGLTCGLGDIYFSRINPAHGWSDPSTSPARPSGRTRRSTSRARPTSRRTEAGSCTSRARASPRRAGSSGRHLREHRGDRRHIRPRIARQRARRRDGGGDTRQRHPAERPEGRPRDRVVFGPLGHARRPGRLRRDPRHHCRSVVCTGQPGRCGQLERGRNAALALVARRAAPIRSCRPCRHCRGRDRRERHLRRDAREERQVIGGRRRGLSRAASLVRLVATGARPTPKRGQQTGSKRLRSAALNLAESKRWEPAKRLPRAGDRSRTTISSRATVSMTSVTAWRGARLAAPVSKTICSRMLVSACSVTAAPSSSVSPSSRCAVCSSKYRGREMTSATNEPCSDTTDVV